MPGTTYAQMLQVTKSTPLYYTITLDSITMADSGARYAIGVDQQAGAKQRCERGCHARRGSRNEKRFSLSGSQMEKLRYNRADRAARHDDRSFSAERSARSD